MQLGLTIPLMKHLKINKLPYGVELHRRFCWDLHCIRLHNHSSLLAVHCETRYMFVLYGMSRAQWNRLPEVFLEGLITSLSNAGLEKKLITSYLQAAGEIELTKTHRCMLFAPSSAFRRQVFAAFPLAIRCRCRQCLRIA